MLPTNDDALAVLKAAIGELDDSASAHWRLMLEGFEPSDSSTPFLGRGLPEGEGSREKSPIHGLGHRLLQRPYRIMGSRYTAFDSLLRAAVLIHRNRGNRMRLGTLRQVVAMAYLDHHLDLGALDAPMVIIGDGFGVMASLALSHAALKTKIVLINLRQNLLADAVYVRRSVPETSVVLAETEEDYRAALQQRQCRVILVRADNAAIVTSGEIGLAVNIASMQEMDLEIVDLYFRIMRESSGAATYFYCANRDEKMLPDGTVTRFAGYPWDERDQILDDGPCAWMQKYYSIRPPFYHPYDGPISHRLVILWKEVPVG